MINEDDRAAFNHRRNPPTSADQGDDMSNPFGSNSSDEAEFYSSPKIPPMGGALDFGGPSSSSSSSDSLGGLGGMGGMGGMGGSTPFNVPSSLPGSSLGGPGNSTYGQQPAKEDVGWEYKMFDALGAGAKATGKGSSAVVKSLGNSNVVTFNRMGLKTTWGGVVMLVGTVALSLTNLFWPHLHHLLGLFIGSMITLITGFAVMGFTYDASAAKRIASEEEEPAPDLGIEPDPEPIQAPNFDTPSEELEWEDDDDWGDDEDDDDGWLDDDEDEEVIPDSADVEEVKESINITPGTQTRAYLFEQYRKILPKSTPSFSKWTEYTSDDDEFIEMEQLLQEATESVMSGTILDEDLPEIIELSENPYIFHIRCTKPNAKFNANKVADELANIYGVRIAPDESGMRNESVFALPLTTGKEVRITLFKGTKGVVVTVGDAYLDEKIAKRVSDPSCKAPTLFGVSERGSVLELDFFEELYSLLISGMPGKGKSWETVSLLVQLAMYLSPRELVYYIGDAKGDASDYNLMNIPHVKHFAGDASSVIKMLKWLVEVEAPRRKAILSEKNKINWKSYMKENPQDIEKMPQMILVLDEMTSLSNELRDKDSKDEYNQFKSYLSTIVSQYRNLGIFFLGIPHRIVDSVIPKTVYSLVSGNINVCGDEDDLKSAVGAKPSNFRYTLTTPGEMAVKVAGIRDGSIAYARGISVSTNDADTLKIYDFIRYIWFKLEHEYYHGPRQDFQDKRNGVFDDYSCGCKSHGGVTGVSISKGSSSSVPPSRGALGPLRGGFAEAEDDVESFSQGALRRDGSSVADVSSSWDDDSSDDPLNDLFGK